MGRFYPPALAVLAAICGGTAAVNSCLDLSTGQCSLGTNNDLDLYNCGITNDDIEDLKACFAHVGEGNVQILSLRSNEFITLPAELFDSFGALTELDVGRNDLETLPQGIFDSLGALTDLNLQNNALATLPTLIFDSLTALTTLSLLGNAFTTLPTGTFDSLTALTTLTLTSNPLETLPGGIFDSLGALTYLSLRNTDLATLPTGLFDSLEALTELNLWFADLETLPTGIFDSLTALTDISLVGNSLKTLPPGVFDSLTLLTKMDLSYNELETLPGGIFDSLTLLTEVDLGRNSLVELPAGLFDSLTLLKKLGMVSNNLKTLPAGIFDSLQALTSLSLNSNELDTLDEGVFDSLTALTSLSLDTSGLTTLPPGLFDSLEALTYLDVARNNLSTLPKGIFDSLGALEHLYLDANQLPTLAPGTFDSLKALEWLFIRDNGLKTLPAGIFDSLEALRYLRLADNPDLTCVPTIPPTVTSIDINELTSSCDCDFGDLTDPCGQQGLKCTPGPSGYLCAVGCDPDQETVQCEADQVCCDDREVCVDFDDVDLYNPTACGDPHMFGFLGQKFDFTGEDGAWYSLIADTNMHINMRVTSPVPGLPEITYITGLSVLTTDAAGIEHSIVIEVSDPHSLGSSCPAAVSPCLADGSLSVFLDGEEALLAPGTVSLSPDVQVSAANLPGACRSFGFEKYWERKKLESARHGRRLSESMSMGEWILGDPTATNMEECAEYVARAEAGDGGVFAHQSEHASFLIMTPKATVRLSHGRLHQIAMRDPTDQFDLPDHLTWQMNMAVDHNEVSRDAKGILGETFVATRDGNGKPIMVGMEAIRGQQDDYRVEGSLGMDFAQDGDL